MLAGPLGGQVAEAGRSHSVGESPVDGCLDEVGREEGERNRHVHLPHAAALTSGDAFGIRSGVGKSRPRRSRPRTSRLKEKIEKLKEEMQRLESLKM